MTDPLLVKAVLALFGPDFKITRGYIEGHDGVDIKAALGHELRTVASGTVSYARDARKDPNARHHWAEGGGNVVNIDIGGNRTIQYAHLHSISVREGTRVARGQLIGKVGATGHATGPHVHFGLLDHNKRAMVLPTAYLAKLAGTASPVRPQAQRARTPVAPPPKAQVAEIERYAAPRHFRVPPGTTLRGYHPSKPGKHLRESSFPNGSGAAASAKVSIRFPGLNTQPVPHGIFLLVFNGVFKDLYIPAAFVVLDPVPEPEPASVVG